MECVISKICVPCWVLNTGCYAPSLSLPLSHVDHPCILKEWERSVFDSILHSWGSRKLTHMLSLFPVGETAGRVRLFALSCVTLEMGWHSKSETVLLTLFSVPNLKIFLSSQWCAGSSLLDSWVPQRYSHLCVIATISVLWGKDGRKLLFHQLADAILLGFPVLPRFGKISQWNFGGRSWTTFSSFYLEVCLFRHYTSPGVRFGRLCIHRELSISFTLWNKFIHGEKQCGF